ncbi:MAG: Fe-S cluster protein [Methanomicrobiales archaeon]|nr:Fe-S cluster protein [Methanomicrobiales archaeon]
MAGDWQPPGKDCGACGAASCADFLVLMQRGEKVPEDCPFHALCSGPAAGTCGADTARDAEYSGTDVSGRSYDFVLGPLTNEPSARKIILPFRADLVERWNIVPGDIVLGRPMGQGCPVQHVLRVIDANPVTGVLTCHTIGPKAARKGTVKDVQAYHVIGFEGFAMVVKKAPEFGLRQSFLPSFCMMDTAHTGFVNMVLVQSGKLHVRVEDIRVL